MPLHVQGAAIIELRTEGFEGILCQKQCLQIFRVPVIITATTDCCRNLSAGEEYGR